MRTRAWIAGVACALSVAGIARAEEIWVTGYGGGELRVVDTATLETLAAIVPQEQPGQQNSSIAFTADGSRAFVGTTTGIAVIDAGTRTVVDRLAIPGNADPFPDLWDPVLALHPCGERLYVLECCSGPINVIDPAGPTLVGTIALPEGSSPYGMGFSPDGRYLYLASYAGEAGVYVVDTDSDTLVGLIPTPPDGPVVVAASPDGRYAAVGGCPDVVLVDLALGAEVGRVPGGCSISLAWDPDGSIVYSGNNDVDFWVVDVTDPTHPVLDEAVQVMQTPPTTSGHGALDLDLVGTDLFATSSGWFDAATLVRFDVSDPLNPVRTGEVPVGDGSAYSGIRPTAAPRCGGTDCTRYSATGFEPPMGSARKRGSTLPMKFALFHDGAAVGGETALAAIQSADGEPADPPRLQLYRLDGATELPLDDDSYAGRASAGDAFRAADGTWMYNLATGTLEPGTYRAKVTVNGCDVSPTENVTFQVR